MRTPTNTEQPAEEHAIKNSSGQDLRHPAPSPAHSREASGVLDARIIRHLETDLAPADLLLDPLADYEPGPPDRRTITEATEVQEAPDLAGTTPKAGDPGGTSTFWTATELSVSQAYQSRPEGYFYFRDGRVPGGQPKQLSNWTAHIIEEVLLDDGGPCPKRAIIMDVSTRGRSRRVQVPANRLAAIRDWLPDALGTAAQIAVMPRVEDHLLQALLQANPDVPERVLYRHCGWRHVEGSRVFLHSGGGIGANGQIGQLSVDLPDALRPLSLPLASNDHEERSAIRAAIGLVDLAGRPLMAALLGAVWRAPLGHSQLAVWVTGATGTGKTELTALAQQHFGAGFDAQHMPAAWSGTANSINELAYLAKDIVLTVDDFVPKGPAQSVARLHAAAETVIRAQGNASGRSRLNAEAQLRDARPPRATLLASGEDVPHGQSLRARMLVVDLAPGQLDFARLGGAQRLGRDGTLATAMAGYIRWLAEHPDRLSTVRTDVENQRAAMVGIGAHRRTASLLAEAAHGWRTLLDYAVDRRAVTERDAAQLWTELSEALHFCGEQQNATDQDADPARRFIEAIEAALSAGRAHLATVSGATPPHAERWGWRRDRTDVGRPWREQGPRIGWIDDADIYLLPELALETARQGTTDPISLNPSTLAKRLHERGLLLAGELKSRSTYTVRKKLQGRRISTWQLRASSFGIGVQEDSPDQWSSANP